MTPTLFSEGKNLPAMWKESRTEKFFRLRQKNGHTHTHILHRRMLAHRIMHVSGCVLVCVCLCHQARAIILLVYRLSHPRHLDSKQVYHT